MSRNKWSKEIIIEEILKLKEQSHPLNAISIMEDNMKLYGAARTHFGSWQNAITSAGLDYSEINHKIKEINWSKDIIAEEIRNIAAVGGDLRSDYIQKNNTKLHSAAQRYFSSWKESPLYSFSAKLHLPYTSHFEACYQWKSPANYTFHPNSLPSHF